MIIKKLLTLGRGPATWMLRLFSYLWKAIDKCRNKTCDISPQIDCDLENVHPSDDAHSNNSFSTTSKFSYDIFYLEFKSYVLNLKACKHDQTPRGETPLNLALFRRNEEEAILLIITGADFNILTSDGDSSLHIAAKQGLIDSVMHLVQKGSDIDLKDKYGNTPLYLALANGYEDVGTFLIKAGADVNIKNNFRDFPLHIAAKQGYINVVQQIVGKGFNINVQGMNSRTPLFLALSNNHENVGRFLLDKGTALCNAPNALIVTRDSSLCEAAKYGMLGIVISFLDRGARINVRDTDGNTPLHLALYHYHESVAKLLIKRGASVNALNCDANTPLGVAAELIHCTDILRALLRNGAEVYYKNTQGYTVLDIAVLHTNIECVNVLLEWGVSVERFYDLLNTGTNANTLKIKKHVEDHSQKLLCIEMAKIGPPQWEKCDPFQKSCMKELMHMKQIQQGAYSLYDILLPHTSPYVAYNVFVEVQLLVSKLSFPIYHTMLCAAFHKDKLRLRKWNHFNGKKCLASGIQMDTPSYHLSDRDLKYLKYVVRERKHINRKHRQNL